MDFALRCNSLKCRTQLTDRAVVTTCSHIFCTRCSENLGLSGAASITRTCPACDARLANNDDAVLTTLNPSEHYKTSVLSGLSPTVIMECAGRGLTFYSYQATQEIVYQEYTVKAMTDKYSTLGAQMDQIIHEANSEISNLRAKITALQEAEAHLRNESSKSLDSYKKKNLQFQKLHAVYMTMRSQQGHAETARAARAQTEQMMDPASHSYSAPRQSGSRASNHAYPIGHRNAEQLHPRQRSGGSGPELEPNIDGRQLQNMQRGQGWGGQSTQVSGRASPHATGTPWGNRSYADQVQGTMFGPQQPAPMRQPLGNPGLNTGRQPHSGIIGGHERQGSPMHHHTDYRPARQSNLSSMMPT